MYSNDYDDFDMNKEVHDMMVYLMEEKEKKEKEELKKKRKLKEKKELDWNH